ncbi:MAG: UbiH/UbiF/VisC/COQ6 family ubiquinone biosynthesis hydroxylase [Gammaproteobacteria bacterium]|nr:UbiH/UbiF/VisC/COQ6 family ubiquinone biosynthesis hydroxylase [Gammaproteobacteria bacterium]
MSTDYDILINGGGMVGATLACALVQSPHTAKLRIGMIEGQRFEKKTDAAWELRVSAITCASQRLFESLGVWPLMKSQRVSPFEAMDVWDAEGTGNIQFYAKEMGEPSLGHIVENCVVQQALYERLDDLGFKGWLCPEKLLGCEKTNEGWQVTLDSGATLTTRLLIGADGALSKVRQLANFKMDAQPYEQSGVVATIHTEKPNGAVARQRFLHSGPLALLPLCGTDGDRHHCSIVWSLDTALAEEKMALDDLAFAQALSNASEFRLGKIEMVDKRTCFPFYERHVESYIVEGVALCGDAAHTIHPLAGQGVNLGLMDAAALAEELHRAAGKGLDIANFSVLRRYARRRRGANTLMMEGMQGFKTLFGSDNLPLRWARNTGMSIMNQVPPVKNRIMRYAMGLEGDIPKLARGHTL